MVGGHVRGHGLRHAAGRRPVRVEGVELLGVDETSFLKATPTAATRWVSAAVEVGRRRVIDVFEGRNASDVDAWLEAARGAGRPRSR